MAGGGGGEGEPEFQVAPMIDVLLTILIFFMTITNAQVLRVDKTIKLPVAPQADKKENNRAETVVNVRWKAATTPPAITIACEPQAKYGLAIDVLNALAAAKISNVTFTRPLS